MTDKLRTWAEIDLDALEHNFDAARRHLPASMKLLVVLKANSYGHGAVRIGRLLEGRADYCAVAFTDEALELRHAGLKAPILLLGHVPLSDFPMMVRYGITATMDDLGEAKLLSDAAVAAGKTAKIHIALDTGMTRIGFDCSDTSIDAIAAIKSLPGIEIEGIYSHFAAADCADQSYSHLQLERFTDFCARLEARGIHIPIRHIQNSAGITQLTCNFEMAREGIILYGMHPSSEVNLARIGGIKPVMSFKTHVVFVKTVPADTPVSYGCTYVTSRTTRIATLAVGYADGLPRLWSGKGRVLIDGREAPIIGRICMDQCMVDVTDLPDVQVGDTATLFGVDGDAILSADTLAESIGTIGYELVCNINPRVPRVYVKDGKFDSIDRELPVD
ncbi:MAG: alanine racemase [Clostridia bacterium]|nr:alanine racemase [Clostridia bacterium]